MNEQWELLRSAASGVLDFLWADFAKEGNESAVLAPLAQYPNAAAWLALCMSRSTHYITRKLAAMLAGWIDDPAHLGLLSDMLEHERAVFATDSLSANSVGEDIMFAATRWTESRDPQIRDAGIGVLASMIRDAVAGTPWNTANWAVANLHHATAGNHEVFRELASATEAQLTGQQFFKRAVMAVIQNDERTLARMAATPPGPRSLSVNNPHYPLVSALWRAAASAESAIG